MRKILLAAGLCLVLLTGALAGCAGPGIDDEVIQIVDSVLETNSKVETFKFTMSILETIDVETANNDEDIPNNMMLTGGGEGLVDIVNRSMQIKLGTSMDIAGETIDNLPIETYMFEGVVYTKVAMPEGEEKWIRMTMPEEMWEQQNQLVQQAEMLDNSDSVKYLGEEDIDDVQCYVVELKPSAESIEKLLSQLDVPVASDFTDVKMDLGSLIQEMVIKQWVAKDSYLFIKTQEHMAMELTPQDIGLSANEFKKMRIVADIEMVFYDYDEPVSIELPVGALDATEISESAVQ
jgi:hypothetical protein